jgi:chromosome segregation and condensation protein ScpB
MVDRILSIYSIVKDDDKKRLKPYEKNVLVYYVRNGITEETLESVCEDRKITKSYLNKINKDLRDKGYLIPSLTNYRKFKLSPDLEEIRQSFIKDKLRLLLIQFVI